MPDATVLLWFLALPILYALGWFIEDRFDAARPLVLLLLALLAGMLFLIVAMVAALRGGAPLH